MRALAAAKDEKLHTFVWRGIGQLRSCEHLWTQRVAGEGGLALPMRIEIFELGESCGNRGHARSQESVGSAHDAILLMQDRRNAAQACGQNRRHRRVAAKTDDNAGPHTAE